MTCINIQFGCTYTCNYKPIYNHSATPCSKSLNLCARHSVTSMSTTPSVNQFNRNLAAREPDSKWYAVETRICAAEMAVRYAALSACQKVHVCHCSSLGGATWRSVMITGRTDRRTDRVRRNMRPPPREEGRIIIDKNSIAVNPTAERRPSTVLYVAVIGECDKIFN